VRRPRTGVVAVAVLAAVLAIAVAVGDRDAGPAPSIAAAGAPTVTGDEARSAAWFCAAGTSDPEGRATETVLVTNLGDDELPAVVTVLPGGDAAPVAREVTVEARSTLAVPVAEILATPEPGVIVEVFGGEALVEHQLANGDDVAVGPCASDAGTEWYFAAGTTSRGAQQFLALVNPFDEDASVDVSFVTDTGLAEPERLQGLTVPRRSRVSVPIHDELRRRTLVATSVRARTGRIVAEQTLILDGSDSVGGRSGIAVSLGASAPDNEWHFPWAGAPGNTGQGIALANFGTTSGEVTMSITLEGNATLAEQTVAVPPRTVVLVDLAGRVPEDLGASVSIGTTRDLAVVAEQLAAGDDGIATALGGSHPVSRWAFANRGRSVALFNPGTDDVEVALLGADGEERERVVVAAGRRLQVGTGGLGIDGDAPLVLDASGPVIAVRIGNVTVSPGVRW